MSQLNWNRNSRRNIVALVLLGVVCWGLFITSTYAGIECVQNELRVDDGDQHCTNTPCGSEWDTFRSMVEVLNAVGANYTISGGTALSWYRDCTLAGNNDLDFNVDIAWLLNNLDELHAALREAGWSMTDNYDRPARVGYEESWRKYKHWWWFGSLKVDLFSVAYVKGEYVTGISVEEIAYPCYNAQVSQPRHSWNGLTFPVPEPIETYLIALYGTTWNKRHVKGYNWATEPFRTDNGRYHCIKEKMPKLTWTLRSTD